MKRAILIIILAALIINPVFSEIKALIQEIKGKVEIRKPEAGWEPARIGMKVVKGSYISTGFRSSVIIDLGTSVLQVKPLSRMQLEELIEKQGTVNTHLFLKIGRVKAEIKTGKSLRANFKLRSPVTTAAVRGTKLDYDGVNLKVEEGEAELSNRAGQTRTVRAGEWSSAPGYQTPTSGAQGREADSIVVSDTSESPVDEEEAVSGTVPLIPSPPAVAGIDILLEW